MNKSYFETCFIPSFDAKDVPVHCFIITAWNPMDQLLSADENRLRNHNLLAKIKEIGTLALPIIGCSMDLSHQEPSFLIDSNKTQAIQWAHEFDQRAIFEIKNKELFILPCDQIGKPISIGFFIDRWIEPF